MRPIDADALLEEAEAVLEEEGRYAALMHIKNLILYAPTIDAAPVRRGEWVEEMEAIPWCEDDCDVYEKCSVCGETSHGTWNFCPNCGADMRVEAIHEPES